MRLRISALTCTTSRSLRMEITLSCRALSAWDDCISSLSAPVTRPYARRIWERSARKVWVASSSTSPRGPMRARMRRDKSRRSGMPAAMSAISGACWRTLSMPALARRWTSMAAATCSRSPPVSVPPSAARVTASEMSAPLCISTSPPSSITARASAVSRCSSATSRASYEGARLSASWRAGKNSARSATRSRIRWNSSVSCACARNASRPSSSG